MRSIEVTKLKESINLLLDLVIKSGVDFIELKDRYYWDVETHSRYNAQNLPGDLVVGDLFDDLEFIEKMLSDRERAIPYVLTQVAPLLLYVGESVSGRLSSP